MGLIKFLKSRFSKNIEIVGDISNHLVYVYKPKKNRIWLGKSLTVPENFTCVFAKEGKALDVFEKGQYELTLPYLPKCTKHFKLEKLTRRGVAPKNFAANCYFVNHKLFDYVEWYSYRPTEIFDETHGYLKCRLSGGFAYRIESAKDFMAFVLKVYDFFYQGEVESVFHSILVDTLLKKIDKNNYDYKSITNKEKITDEMFDFLEKQMQKNGVILEGLSIENVKFKKKDFKRILENEKLKKLEQKTQEIISQPLFSLSEKISLKNEEKLSENNAETEEESIESQRSKKSFNNWFFNRKELIKEENFENGQTKPEIYSQNKIETAIICKYCGAKNGEDDESCALCGEDLKGE
ncbi:MAG: SPFH domain-containing protein [Christensenellales bacterium]|jgi:membrane protease subunit (stomatin/prohibitin family)/ribosomal protein L40E